MDAALAGFSPLNLAVKKSDLSAFNVTQECPVISQLFIEGPSLFKHFFYWVFPRNICEINAKYQCQKHSFQAANFVSGYRFAAREDVFSIKDKVMNRLNQSLLYSMQSSYATPVVIINNCPSNSCAPAHQADSSTDMDQTLAGHRTFFFLNRLHRVTGSVAQVIFTLQRISSHVRQDSGLQVVVCRPL